MTRRSWPRHTLRASSFFFVSNSLISSLFGVQKCNLPERFRHGHTNGHRMQTSALLTVAAPLLYRNDARPASTKEFHSGPGELHHASSDLLEPFVITIHPRARVQDLYLDQTRHLPFRGDLPAPVPTNKRRGLCRLAQPCSRTPLTFRVLFPTPSSFLLPGDHPQPTTQRVCFELCCLAPGLLS